MLHNFIGGLTALLNGPAIAYLVAGSLAGMFLGVIPGLGGAVILSVILAFIYHLSLTATICLFLATQAGSYFSASVTSILLNTPAHPEAFAVTFDGFPMAQRGEAGRALGISATSTCIGGLIGCAVLVGFLQVVNYLPLIFHPPEYVALISMALVLVGTLGADAASKALISVGIGLMISTVGADPITGAERFTFGAVGLLSGVSLVALALGLFAIPQMVLVFGTGTAIARQNMLGQEVESSSTVELGRGFGSQVRQGVFDTFHHWFILLRAALVGSICGVVPGIGGFAANFISYGIAQQTSKRRELFGTGIPEGIIAPEGSSLAKEAGGMVPVIALGIPGSVGTALFLAALSIKDVRVGYGLMQNYPTLPYEMVWVIALGGLIGTAAGLATAPWLAKVTHVPGPVLVPFIMSFAVIGSFVSNVAFFSVMEVLVFAMVGFTLRRLRYSLAAFAVGLVLGPSLESNIYLTHTVYPGITFLERPIADVLFLIGLVALIGKSVQLRRETRGRAQVLANSDATPGTPEELTARHRQRYPYPSLSMTATLSIAGVSIWSCWYAGTRYSATTALMPLIGGGVAGFFAVWRLPTEVRRYLQSRRALAEMQRAPAEYNSAGAASEAEGVAVGVGSREEVLSGLIHGPGTVLAATAEQDQREVDSTAGAPPAALAIHEAATRSPIEERTWGHHGQYTRELAAFGWFGLVVVASYLLGFVVAIPLFCVVYGFAATRRVFTNRIRRALFALVSAAVMWAITYELLSVLHIVNTPKLAF